MGQEDIGIKRIQQRKKESIKLYGRRGTGKLNN
jgi:hypothetical protein